MSIAKLEVSFTSAVASDPIKLFGEFNRSYDFTTGSGVGTIALERSFDDGVTFETVESDTADKKDIGTAVGNLVWRANCTAYTSGTIKVILEQ